MTNDRPIFADLVDSYKHDGDFIAERLLLDIGENIVECMQMRNKTRAGLAEDMGVSKAYVTKLLNGQPNMTIKTLAGLAAALRAEIKISMKCPVEQMDVQSWIDNIIDQTEDSLKYDQKAPYTESKALAIAA